MLWFFWKKKIERPAIKESNSEINIVHRAEMDSPPAIIPNDESEPEKLLADDRLSKITIEKQELASMIDAAVENVLSRIGSFSWNKNSET